MSTPEWDGALVIRWVDTSPVNPFMHDYLLRSEVSRTGGWEVTYRNCWGKAYSQEKIISSRDPIVVIVDAEGRVVG